MIVGMTDEYGNIDSDYGGYYIGGNQNKYRFSAKVFLKKNKIDPISGSSAFNFDVSFDSRFGAPWVITNYHYFYCKGIPNTASENAPINMDIYFLM